MHTPGPWEAQDFTASRDERGQAIIAANLGGMVCWLGDSGANFRRAKTREANARLIAAAPELLEALQEFIRMDDDSGLLIHNAGSDLVLGLDAAKKAIAKALGK